MEYTNAMYEEDNKIANWVFKKYFIFAIDYKADLIQEALMQLWNARKKKDETKSKYFSFAIICSYYAMCRYLRKIKFGGKNLRTKTQLTILSYDTNISEDTTLIELLGKEDNHKNFDYDYLLKTGNEIINNHKSKALKKIASLVLQCKTPTQITKELNISRQAVSLYIIKFRKLLTEKLKEENYF